MPPSSIRRALGAVKDQTSIGLAKVGSSASLADLDVAIVKATRHDEYPSEEKYIREILSLTCYSRAFISACVNTLSRRLSKTKSWTVALKTLVLIQRLLAEGDPAYEQEIFFATRRGTRLLNMSDFRDNSKSGSWDFSAFVRTYSLYLDERLEYKMQSRRGKRSMFGFDEDEEEREKDWEREKEWEREREKEWEREREREREMEKDREIVVRSTPVREMKLEQFFSKMQHLQLLLERFLACRPTGGAKNHRIVIVALYPIVKESFQIYYDISEILNVLIDRFPDMDIVDCVKVYDIFCRVGKQFDELDLFYGWSKNIGIARSSEYPELEKVTPKKLEVMEEFIKDKNMLAQTYKTDEQEEKNEDEETKEPEPEPEEDMNAVKALPPPPEEPTEEVVEEPKVEEPKEEKVVQTEGDLLNLGDDRVTTEEHGDKLALALFDGAAPVTEGGIKALPWHAFDEGADWETALIQSASHLGNQQPALGGGFDTLLLDGMYKQGEMNAAMQGVGFGGSGSASSVALGSAGRPAMLALPAPPTSGTASDSNSGYVDPFAASLAIAPPSYVQMSEMEKKQRLLVEEQILWQQYQNDRIQGHAALRNQQQGRNNNSYGGGGYPQNYGNYHR